MTFALSIFKTCNSTL